MAGLQEKPVILIFQVTRILFHESEGHRVKKKDNHLKKKMKAMSSQGLLGCSNEEVKEKKKIKEVKQSWII